MGQATGHAFDAEGMIIQRLPDDLFRHRVLGFGTGDFVVKPASGDTFEIHNVWRANSKQRQPEDRDALCEGRVSDHGHPHSGLAWRM